MMLLYKVFVVDQPTHFSHPEPKYWRAHAVSYMSANLPSAFGGFVAMYQAYLPPKIEVDETI
jgi:hypothetical protein